MKKNNITLSELRNIIKEEIQSQLTKKNLVESVNKKSKKSILKEEAKIEFKQPLRVTTVETFRIENPNPNDKITVIDSQSTTAAMQVNFIYILETEAGTPAYNTFMNMRKTKPEFFFSTDTTSLIIPNHNTTLSKITPKIEPPLSYRLELVVTKPANLNIDLSNFKGQQS